ncbi:MAG: prepilin-type N-terminal cleavage/methylation domain-containing protein [Candidatus Hydrogenedens sp.]|nr:prepilin-type N-terminal cleavage/methylation domain-containing protein [Candidatus Hydrogenedens sp.]
MSRPSAARGFTLLELIVVLAVLSVVSTLGISAFVSVTSYYNTTARRMALDERARQVFESIQEDCAMMVPSGFAGCSVFSKRQMEETKRYGRVPLENDQMVLPIAFYNPVTEATNRASVLYAIDRSEAQPRLIRRLEGGFGNPAPQGAEEIVAEGVLAMRIDYFDGKRWLPEWTAAQHPDAIRVSLVLQDLDRPYEQVARKCAFPIQVN